MTLLPTVTLRNVSHTISLKGSDFKTGFLANYSQMRFCKPRFIKMRFEVKHLLVLLIVCSTSLAAYVRGEAILAYRGGGLKFGLAACIAASTLCVVWWNYRRLLFIRIAVSGICTFVFAVIAVPTYFCPMLETQISESSQARLTYKAVQAIILEHEGFSEVEFYCVYGKCVELYISGSVVSDSDFHKLRILILTRCKFVGRRFLLWDVLIEDAEKRIYVYDSKLPDP
jgi:hypothetical protein